jgi:hypothetical protein
VLEDGHDFRSSVERMAAGWETQSNLRSKKQFRDLIHRWPASEATWCSIVPYVGSRGNGPSMERTRGLDADHAPVVASFGAATMIAGLGGESALEVTLARVNTCP